jgi:hypothetical protein
MSKRPSSAAGKGSAKKARPGGGSLDADLHDDQMPKWLELDKVFEVGGPVEFLDAQYGTADARDAFAQKLHSICPLSEPAATGLEYLKKEQTVGSFTGKRLMPLWAACWDVYAGNKGLVLHSTFAQLCGLIAAQGFRTNPDLAGTEAIVIADRDDEAVNVEVGPPMAGHEELAPPRSVAFVKGWTRCVAALIVGHFLTRQPDDEIQKLDQDYLKSFGAVHVIKPVYNSREARIDANSGAFGI